MPKVTIAPINLIYRFFLVNKTFIILDGRAKNMADIIVKRKFINKSSNS